ncbi:M14 family zinc carboxypeptidase [Aquimarina brevivitae]|uniref:Putative secreted protein (Por secretion system target) n=1 Tax=Aquimarina brevivitae TaxID=323412 RepID=A0A4Q7P0X3_9FLAO|nr:M14 family zinc carboxypeptidase [Aquimarina brevivitae]RZS93456.1 putative secreted protein (Por secretion system target) [Aquimarina brevivitae]
MKKLLFALVLLSFVGFSQQKPNYSKVKIYYQNQGDLKSLTAKGIPLDHGVHKANTFFISYFSNEEIKMIKEAGFEVKILIEDAEADFIKRNKSNDFSEKNLYCPSVTTPIDYPTPTNFSLGSMGGYLTYQEMLDNLDAMHNLYPNLISARFDIGNFTTEGTPDNSTTPAIGGNKLQWVKISDKPDTDEDEPEVLYDAIHHAREPASLSQLIFYMWYLLENYETDPLVKQIVDHTELYFVPVVNPDGYLYNEKTNPNGGGLWRKNRYNTHGVDLNRNYDYYPTGDASSSVWGGQGASPNTSSDTYRGATPFSEVETQAMKWFVEQHNFSVALNNHTFGDLLLYPFGYTDNAPTPDDDYYKQISAIMVTQNGYNNIISAGLYPAAGDSDDFMYGTIGTHTKVFAFTPEIGDEFWPASSEIIGICKEMVYLNLAAAKIAGNYAKLSDTSAAYIEDNPSFNASYTIENVGVSGTGNFQVSVNPISANIESVGDAKSYTSLSFGSPINDQIIINLNNSINYGDIVEYQLILDTGTLTEAITVTKTYGKTETIVDNSADNLNEFNSDSWGTTNTTYVSAVSSITDSPGGDYNPNQNNAIQFTNTIDLTEAITAKVSFFAKWDIENNWDYVQFQVSEDGGSNWIPQCGKHTNSGSTNSGQPTGEPLYDGLQEEWIKEEVNLSDYLGKSINIRFVLVSDQAVENDGFYFDDLELKIIKEEPLNVADINKSNISLFPNPTKGILHVTLASEDKANATVYNIYGQIVVPTKQITESGDITLNGLANGVYFINIQQDKAEKNYKVIKL